MAKPFFVFALACFFLILAGCREDAVISRTNIQFLQQGILVTHWSDEDHYSKYTEQLDTLYINQGVFAATGKNQEKTGESSAKK